MDQKATSTSTAGWILILVLAITPFVSSKALQEQFLLPRTILWSLAICALGVSLLARRKGAVSVPYLSLAWGGVILWLALGYSSALSHPEWLLTTSRMLLYGATLWGATFAFRRNLISYRDLSRGLSLLGIIGGLFALGAWSQANDVYEVFKPFGHKNFISAALLIALLGSLPSVRDTDRLWKVFGIASVAIATVTIILLRTRGIWIASILASVFLLLASMVFKPKDLKTTIIPVKYIALGFGLLIIGIVAVVSQPSVEEKVLDSANIDFRFKYWNHSVKMFEEEPVMGVGAGQWRFHFPKYGLEGTNTRVSNGETAIIRPHNDFLWMLAEGGLPAFIFYLTFWIGVLVSGIRKLMKENGESNRVFLMSAMAVVIAFLAYAMGEFPIERVDIAIPVFMAAAYIIRNDRGRSLPGIGVYAIVTLLSVITLYTSVRRYGQEPFVSEINEGNDRQQPQAIIQAYDQVNLDVVDVDQFANPLPYFNGLSNLFAGQQAGNTQMINEAKQSFEDALAIHPWHVATYNQYGNWYKYQNRYDEALNYYDQGLKISPLNIDLRLNKAEAHLLKGNADGCALILLNFIGQEENPKYQRLVVQSLRKIEGESRNTSVNDFLMQTDITSMNDGQLLNAFIRFREREHSGNN